MSGQPHHWWDAPPIGPPLLGNPPGQGRRGQGSRRNGGGDVTRGGGLVGDPPAGHGRGGQGARRNGGSGGNANRGGGDSGRRGTGGVNPSRGRGQQGQPPDDRNDKRDKEQGPSGSETSRQTTERREHKGPVFGFRRLNGFLSEEAEGVIMSISRDLEEWKAFMDSDELGKDNILALVLQMLAQKICSETVLNQQQFKIISMSNTPNFINKINEKCNKISMTSVLNPPAPSSTYRPGNFVEIDTTPKTFLTSLQKYGSFVAKKMPGMAVDYLLNIVCTAVTTVATMTINDISCQPLHADFTRLWKDIQNIILEKQKESAVKSDPGSRQRRANADMHRDQLRLHEIDAPSDFRELSVVPTAEDLTSKEDVFLRTNIINGAYKNPEHYLDVQFRLLREDFVRPLKRGIQDFLRNRFEYETKKNKMPLGSIRMYREVQIIGGELVRDVLVFKLQLADDVYKNKRIKWDRSKRLLTGSLLVLTRDDFTTASFAVVASRNIDELSKGILSISWEGEPPQWDRDDEFLMVECEVYFEAYRHTLQILKELPLESFPMCKFIVTTSSDVQPPEYIIRSGTMIELRKKDGGMQHISPLLPEMWPSAKDLGLDDNQFAAFQAALTKQFVIIQGPPGTGKTYLGLRIAEVFLRNQNVWRVGGDNLTGNGIPSISKGPILVVCYTNHALDQFLEGFLDLLSDADQRSYRYPIIRVGGRSQSEALQPFTLSTIMRNIPKHERPRGYGVNKYNAMKVIDELRYKRSTLIGAIAGLRAPRGIVDFVQLEVWKELSAEYEDSVMWDSFRNKEWFGLPDSLLKSKQFNPNLAIRTCLNVLDFSKGKVKKQAPQPQPETNLEEGSDDDLDEDYDVDELMQNRMVDDPFELGEAGQNNNQSNFHGNVDAKLLKYLPGLSVSSCEKEYTRLEKRLAILRSTINAESKKYSTVQFQTKQAEIAQLQESMQIALNTGKFLVILMDLYANAKLELPDTKLSKERISQSQVLSKSWEIIHMSIRWALYFEMVERARVLSAKKCVEVEQMLSREQKNMRELDLYAQGHVLEQSLVVGMTTTGAAKYNDLLKMMKSKIVIVEEAAEILECHIVTSITKSCEHLILIGDHLQLRPSTTVYELAKDYHLDVSLFERMLNNKLHCYQLKMQHRMRPEIADLVVGTIYDELANAPNVSLYPEVSGLLRNLYFISHTEKEKADSDSMSKSNLYEAQFLASLCRHLILNGYSSEQITVLTTYTGQMFLLKSTFRELPNCQRVRITCVDNYQGEENDIILLSLVRSNPECKIGFLSIDNRVCVALSRAKHGMFIIGNMRLLSSKSKTWSKIREKLDKGGLCGRALTLQCKIHHTLSEVQTVGDFMHQSPDGGCTLPCDTPLLCTHNCTKICHVEDRTHEKYRCPLPCRKQCRNLLHPCRDLCFKKCPDCVVPLIKKLPCDHEVETECFRPPESIKCMELVDKSLPCGHKQILACYRDPAAIKCLVEVEKRLLHCDHRRVLKCHQDPGDITCKVEVVKTLVPCGHLQKTECRFDPTVVKCKTMLSEKIPLCGHEKTVECANRNRVMTCLKPCDTRLSCGHACTRLCHVSEDPKHLAYICKKPCAKPCSEGHTCSSGHNCYTPCPPCNVVVKRILPNCAHTVDLSCHINPLTYECLVPCERRLNCYHDCKNLCYQPCGPCMTIVKRRIPSCRHLLSSPCNERPDQSSCNEPVTLPIIAACGHQAKVPCRLSLTGVSPEEAMTYCTEPCGGTFPDEPGWCEHPCQGNCGSCFQGCFHQKCQEKCGKAWPCGHVCDSPCSKTCPPCKKPCASKCEHSQCKNECGVPCEGCSEPCPWQCPHKKCTKLCRDMCDRDPCDEPCTLTLQKCGHPCIGFCGEPCPPQCRVCDRDELTEFILYGNEEEEDSRFVFLPDCKHAIEVEGLDYYMTGMSDGSQEINAKACPRCKTIIRNCRRFNNALKGFMVDVIAVKKKIFGNAAKITTSRNRLIERLRSEETSSWSSSLPHLHQFISKRLFNALPSVGKEGIRIRPKQVDEGTLTSLTFLADYAQGVGEVLSKAKTSLRVQLLADLSERYRKLFANVVKRPFPLTRVEFRDIARELERFFELNQVYSRRSHPNFPDGHVRGNQLYDKLLQLVLCNKPFTDEVKRQIRISLKELEEAIRTGLGISDMERRQILQAVGLGSGHWFKCRNGHVYAIGECGGAMQEATCPECQTPIGGLSHRLTSGNQLATEMDRATAPAYPSMHGRY